MALEVEEEIVVSDKGQLFRRDQGSGRTDLRTGRGYQQVGRRP